MACLVLSEKANLGNDWGRSHESILHFRKSKDFIFNEFYAAPEKRSKMTTNEKIDIPYIPEQMEKIAFKFVIGMIVKAARKNLKLSSVLDTSDSVVVTASDDDIEDILKD